MKNVKTIFKKIPKEKIIILTCAIMSAITLFVSVIIFASADSNSEKNGQLTQKEPEESQEVEKFSPDSPKSLSFTSLDDNTCVISSIGAFSGEDLEIPEKSPRGEKVVGISSGAFEGCDELISVHIPSTVTSIGDGVFKGCSSLTVITVDRSNTKFSAAGGILYSKSKNLLICYPSSRIGSSYLLNPNVKTIADDAFYGVKNLSCVYYEGTTEEFGEIAIGDGNRTFLSLPITCNYSPSK